MDSFHSTINTPPLPLLSPLSPSFLLAGHGWEAVISRATESATAMLAEEEALRPALEDGMPSACEILPLFSLIQSRASLSPSSASQGSSRAVYSADERKRRRMVSNRESAKRSRWRKKRHVENLSVELNHLKTENREAQNRLRLLFLRRLLLTTENSILKSESISLLSRLSHLCWLLRSHSQAHATCPIIFNQ